MPGDGERYDVVVVGVQGDDAAAADLSADLSSLTGLSAAKVSLALRNGELIVHRSLPDADARRAANALRRRGADVQIRSIDEAPGGVPDIDAVLGGAGLLLPHAGGAPAPIAPPPEFGGATRARNIDIGPRASASTGLVDPSRPQGRPDDPSSERPFAGAFERATERGRPTPHGSPQSGRAAEEPENEEPKKIRDNYVGTPRRSKPPEARGVAGQIADAQRLAESLEAAAEAADVVEVVTLDGVSSESVEVKLGAGPGAAAAAGVVVAAAPAVTREPAPPPRRSGPPADALALDFDGEAPARAAVSGTQARVEAARVDAGPSARVSASPPVRPQPATMRGSSPRAVPAYAASNRLFSPDPIANYLFGVAVGLAIGMVIAFVVVRMWSRGDVLALEEELAVSYTKPLQVEAGESRTPAVIEEDLEAAYGRSRWFFLLTMIVVGVPVGLGLGHFKR